MVKALAVGWTALLAAGCVGGLHSDAPPTQIYVLRATAAARNADASVLGGSEDRAGAATQETGTESASSAVTRAAASPEDGAPAPSVQLPRPSADPGLGTELIMLVRSDHRLDYYFGSRWAANLPDVVETLAIDTLRANGAWGAVHESPSPFFADYLLQINIRRFEADYTSGAAAPRVIVVLDCTLVRRIGRDLIASFVAQGEADAEENRLGAVVAAFEKAANAALTTMADRSAAAARTSPPVASAP
jgi:cholesterol transport system auxiliary component